MRDVLPTLGIAAAALALIAIVVFGGGDRQVLVPPPDAVAESFTREVVEGRYQLASKYLSRDLRKRVSAADLRRRFRPVRAQLGPPHTVAATLDWLGNEEAMARAMVDTSRGSAVLSLSFTREQGLWVLREVPDPAMAFSGRARR